VNVVWVIKIYLSHNSSSIEQREVDDETQRLVFFYQASSIEFYREGRKTPGYGLYDWLHGYVYARWPYLYIGIAPASTRARLTNVFKSLSRLLPARQWTYTAGAGQISADVTIQPRNFCRWLPCKVSHWLGGAIVTVHEEVKITI